MKLTQKIVRKFLDYNPKTGELTWRHRNRKWFNSNVSWKIWNIRYANKKAFTSGDGKGYLHGSVFHKSYKAHQIIWLRQTGNWPNPEIDHINHIRNDNRWTNLRETSVNQRNASRRKDNKSGQTGVHRVKNTTPKIWKVVVGNQHVGMFDTFKEAVKIRKQAEKKYNFHSNHGSKNDLPIMR